MPLVKCVVTVVKCDVAVNTTLPPGTSLTSRGTWSSVACSSPATRYRRTACVNLPSTTWPPCSAAAGCVHTLRNQRIDRPLEMTSDAQQNAGNYVTL